MSCIEEQQHDLFHPSLVAPGIVQIETPLKYYKRCVME